MGRGNDAFLTLFLLSVTMGEEITFLDLGKVELYGWETAKNIMLIDSMVRGIEAGDDFPLFV